MKNVLKEKMLKGEQVVGSFFQLASPVAVECLGISKLDYVILDKEHGPFGVESIADFIRAAELRGITPIVRIKDVTRPSVLKPLDVGAMGLIVPAIKTADEVRRLVEYGKYYPLGNRGVVMARKVAFGYDDFCSDMPTYFETCNRETMIIPQCETAECLEHIEEIVDIPGVDGIFVGPYDLSTALGIPGQFDNPIMQKAAKRVADACKNAGKFSFVFSTKIDDAKAKFALGYNAIAFNMDANILIQAYRNLLETLKG